MEISFETAFLYGRRFFIISIFTLETQPPFLPPDFSFMVWVNKNNSRCLESGDIWVREDVSILTHKCRLRKRKWKKYFDMIKKKVHGVMWKSAKNCDVVEKRPWKVWRAFQTILLLLTFLNETDTRQHMLSFHIHHDWNSHREIRHQSALNLLTSLF